MSYALLYSMFFLMSFLFIHGLKKSPISAGIHLAVIPIALGLVAPISGSIYARVGARTMTTSAMVLCLGALVLWREVCGSDCERFRSHGALLLFGAGLGMFIAPNNSATIAAAPEDRTGEAGGMLNLMRVLGCTIRIAAASAAFSLRLHALTGNGNRTTSAPTKRYLRPPSEVLWLLGGFAVAAGSCALLRDAVRRRA